MALFSRALSVVNASKQPLTRCMSFGSKSSKSFSKAAAAGGAACFAGVAGAVYYAQDNFRSELWSFPIVLAAKDNPCKLNVPQPCPPKNRDYSSAPEEEKKKVAKKKCSEPQANVISPIKKYSLFLWITLEPSADPCSVANAAIRVPETIEATRDPSGCYEDVVAGVGFGPNLFAQVFGVPCKNFCYRHRKGKNGDMPVTDGDLFVHAKADNLGQLFDFAKTYLRCFPAESILEFEDVYGFEYRNGRDISGFLDNQTNRCSPEGLAEVAVECDTGGSYALTQKWIHDFCVIDGDQDELEQYIGRDLCCGGELDPKTITSHVARMTGTTDKNPTPVFEIVRQSQSFGTLSDKAGQFFMGYSADPIVFDTLLDRMVGASCDGEHDDVMKISKNVKGAYWYFPGVKELDQLRGAAGSS